MGFTATARETFAKLAAAERTAARAVEVRYKARGAAWSAAEVVRMTVGGLEVGHVPEAGGYEEEVQAHAVLEKALVDWEPEQGAAVELVESGERYRVVTVLGNAAAEWRLGLGAMLRGK